MHPGWEFVSSTLKFFLSRLIPSPLLCSVFTRERSDFERKRIVLTSFRAKNEPVDFGWVVGVGFQAIVSVGSSLGGLSLEAVEEIFISFFGEEKYGD